MYRETILAALDTVATELDRRGAAELASAADAVAEKLDPDSYKKKHGRCPRGYRFNRTDNKCVPAGGGGKKKGGKGKGKGKDSYKMSPKIRKATTIGDIPDGVKGLKGAFGEQLGISKYPPPDIDPSTIKIDLSGDSDSHAVMTWRDKKGRLQAAYSNTFKKRNAAKKWERVKKLGPKYDKAVDKFAKTMNNPKASDRDRDAAAAMTIIAKTGLRPGGEAHLKATGSRGIGTLSPENVTIEGDTVKLKFVGKAGKENTAEIKDPELAKYLQERLKNPASKDRLFNSKDADLKKTMKAGGLADFKPKDFRTLQAGKLASDTFSNVGDPPPPLPKNLKKAKKLIFDKIKAAAKVVSDALNNTPAVAKSSYINPAIIQAWINLVGGKDLAVASVTAAKKMKPPTMDEIFKEAMKIELPGADEDAEPLDEDDPQLEEDPIPEIE